MLKTFVTEYGMHLFFMILNTKINYYSKQNYFHLFIKH